MIVDIFHPLIEKLVSNIPNNVAIIIIIISAVLYVVDHIVTILQVINYGKHTKELERLSNDLRFTSDKIGQKVSDATRVLMEQYDKVNEN